MAIRSAYIITEEQDGFVAVDFDFINAYDEVDRHDLTAWEFVDQVDADVDYCSEENDDVSESVESDVSSEYRAETIVGEDVESLPELSMLPEYVVSEDEYGGRSDDVSKSVDFAGECLSDGIAGEVAKSVPETIISPEYSENTVGEGAKSVANSIISPEYFEDTIAAENAKSAQNWSLLPESMTERIDDYSVSVPVFRSRDEKYCYEDEDVEEDDYDLDDELVPYYVNGKLGRERMRKLGKRSCTKSVKTKRLTYNYNKAGCFRGKHGLGLKHSLM
ncbi:hypothetical protein POM88_053522 [Heracleum sosnowskyi]|uniref:Uncharacterized protein n=1 Tax=Heracleum sosnowskyi TaxID=360622 RepID=A0AAD8GQH2_9APIA|nr:hypothetical protein POM88_053522 [Heracleum sosnowskyi]